MTENTLEEQIYQFIKEQNLLEAGDACIVGVSGGADSICLLTVLAGLREKMDLKLYAVHVNHMIRGTEADASYRAFLPASSSVSFCFFASCGTSIW